MELYKDFEELFDEQIKTLKDRSCPEWVIELLVPQRDSVILKAGKMTFGNGHIPFIPVISRMHMTFDNLMKMAHNGSGQGRTLLSPADIIDWVKTPDNLYWMYHIDDGESVLNKSPNEAEKIFKKQSRSPLIVAEDIALTTHTDVLLRHYVIATGSRYIESDGVPVVWLNDDRPWLGWYGADDLDSGGFPSCGSRG